MGATLWGFQEEIDLAVQARPRGDRLALRAGAAVLFPVRFRFVFSWLFIFNNMARFVFSFVFSAL
jgi:hypothetical protein